MSHHAAPAAASAAAIQTIRRSALYDLIITGPFATPWTARWVISALGALHDRLGLPGERPALPGITAALLASLMGTVVVVWSLVRLRAPTLAHGTADALARAGFSLWMIWALAAGGSPVLGGFLVAEIAWGIAQARAVRVARYASE